MKKLTTVLLTATRFRSLGGDEDELNTIRGFHES